MGGLRCVTCVRVRPDSSLTAGCEYKLTGQAARQILAIRLVFWRESYSLDRAGKVAERDVLRID